MDQNNNYGQQYGGTTPDQGYTQQQQTGYYQQPGQDAYQQQPDQNYQYQQPNQNYYTPPVQQGNPDTGLGAICYLGPIFYLVALVANGTSPFVRHHANQGLALDVLTMVSMLMLIIPFLGWIAYGIFSIVLFVFRIMGIFNARGGGMSSLPICGGWIFFS